MAGLGLAVHGQLELILLDAVLPLKDGFDVLKANGFEALSELKASQKTRDASVIVLSNLGQEEDIRRAKDLGAAEFLAKSNLSIHDIVDRVMEAYKPGPN